MVCWTWLLRRPAVQSAGILKREPVRVCLFKLAWLVTSLCHLAIQGGVFDFALVLQPPSPPSVPIPNPPSCQRMGVSLLSVSASGTHALSYFPDALFYCVDVFSPDLNRGRHSYVYTLTVYLVQVHTRTEYIRVYMICPSKYTLLVNT